MHGAKYRPIENASSAGASAGFGHYGRLFPVAPYQAALPEWLQVRDAALDELAASMLDDGTRTDNPHISAGITYFAQFVDHDITFDPTPVPEQRVDPRMVYNYRTPRLDLDCLYGLGPTLSPYLYQRDWRAKFLLGSAAPDLDPDKTIRLPEGMGYDLPRNAEGMALIGDPRNDQNLILSQLHLVFMRYHNAVADEVASSPETQLEKFEQIRSRVTRRYQWLVLNALVKPLADPKVFSDVEENGGKIYGGGAEPFIPVEFSVAAFRFGHSMVRESYDYNQFFGSETGAFATLKELLPLMSRRRAAPFTSLPARWVIDWNRFFTRGKSEARNHSRRIDALLAPTLHGLPQSLLSSPVPSLPASTLRRGRSIALPSGQSVAEQLHIEPLQPDEIAASGRDGAIAAQHGLHRNTPLWYYVLKEAELRQGGERLGELGSRLVVEVFFGLLRSDPLSILAPKPRWERDAKPDPDEGFSFERLFDTIEGK